MEKGCEFYQPIAQSVINYSRPYCLIKSKEQPKYNIHLQVTWRWAIFVGFCHRMMMVDLADGGGGALLLLLLAVGLDDGPMPALPHHNHRSQITRESHACDSHPLLQTTRWSELQASALHIVHCPHHRRNFLCSILCKWCQMQTWAWGSANAREGTNSNTNGQWFPNQFQRVSWMIWQRDFHWCWSKLIPKSLFLHQF